MEINKGIQPFDEGTDFSRGNKDRQRLGSTPNAQQFHMGDEYDAPPPPETPPVPPVVPPIDPPAPKFTHKLANGTVLEAATIEELATKIEHSLVQAPPAPAEYEDKPLYTPMEFKPKELTLVEQAEILNLWKENPQKALAKLQEAQFGASLDVVLGNLSRAEQRELNRRQEEAGVEFILECDTYNATRGNAKKLTDLLHSKNKPITKHNLVLAFQQLSATDQTLIRKAEETPVPPDPVSAKFHHLRPSCHQIWADLNQPRPLSVDAAKFAALPLDKQKQYFADLRRGR